MRLSQWVSFGRASLTRSVILAVVALVLAILLSNCDRTRTTPTSSPSPLGNSPAAVSPGTLVYGAGGEPVNLEPGNIEDGNSLIVQQQIYNRLVQFKPGTTDLEPALATEWKSSEGGKVWTFKLRSGVKFHDGTDFDAEAVRFNVDRWWNPKSDYGYL
jgi:peptide/nickel transport system substrate-binding protein